MEFAQPVIQVPGKRVRFPLSTPIETDGEAHPKRSVLEILCDIFWIRFRKEVSPMNSQGEVTDCKTKVLVSCCMHRLAFREVVGAWKKDLNASTHQELRRG
ncbi:MAG: hypothetical protein WC712_01875 [Candidatus Brocadiia bacterium]